MSIDSERPATYATCFPSLGDTCGNCHRCEGVIAHLPLAAEVGGPRDRCTCAYVGPRQCVNKAHSAALDSDA